MRINVVGLGYIGLPTALVLATSAHAVTGTDVNAELVDTLRAGKLTFDEPGMETIFTKALTAGISFSTQLAESEVYIVAVPTPFDVHSKRVDTTYIANAVEAITKIAPDGAIVAIESTISPGTIDRTVRQIVAANCANVGKSIHLAHVPERIIPGNMLYELRHNSRTIGADDAFTREKLKAMYGSFCSGELVTTSIKVAELTKVAENTSRDIQIAFANELARICHREEIDVYKVISIANRHPRVQILNPGPGVGGHCISVDPWFLVGDYPDMVDIVASARRVNDSQPDYVLERVYEIMTAHGIKLLSDVGFYGVTYKENVDDTRESPTLQLLDSMKHHLAFGAKVYDPYVTGACDNQYDDFNRFLSDIRLLVVMVKHRHILESQAQLVDSELIIYDTVNCLSGDNVYKL